MTNLFAQKKYSTKKQFIFAAIVSIMILVISSCYTPSPLYGKWQTSGGKTITFIQGGSWIGNLSGSTEEGEWSTYDNVIYISFSDGESFVSEWDIRGSILKLNWFDGTEEIPFTLFRVSK